MSPSIPPPRESHGPAIGCVIDGCPPGMALSEADIQIREGNCNFWKKAVAEGNLSFLRTDKAFDKAMERARKQWKWEHVKLA